MKEYTSLLVGLIAALGLIVYSVRVSGHTDELAAPIYGVTIPPDYRDWKLISVAHEEGNLNDLRAQLGNDIAIKAYREGTLPFPDGSIIAAIHWTYVSSEENTKVFGRDQSFVAGPPKNMQFMVKDSTKYAATGGWGFADFTDGKPADEATQKSFSVSPARQSSRLRLHPLRTFIPLIGDVCPRSELSPQTFCRTCFSTFLVLLCLANWFTTYHAR